MCSSREKSKTKVSRAKTAEGVPKFDLIKSRHGKKYFPKIVKVDKDHSWRDMIVSLVIEVSNFTGHHVELNISVAIAVPRDTHKTKGVHPCAR